ncbi:hypothetical protein [Sphingomonas sp. LaA6.9]|uniref:hypothetical protein n=1 Tax=Sphingomonas sp. LaA6.9 TaxID=2919914 RepID=UPI001F4FF6C0|nr:hypothetical protein [Sphingomonas sp. LaA6.9]MCJ8157643.1 hypothetical protein [Sphingomonas sp. LaA6.9]
MFELSRQGRTAVRLVPDRIVALQAEVKGCLAQHGVEPGVAVAHECAAFVFWSVHVGIVNARTSELDRWVSRRMLNRVIRRSDPEIGALYARRCQEALAATPNIYLYRGKRGEPELPVTHATVRLFLRKLTGMRFAATADVVQDLLDVLRTAFWSWVGAMNPHLRTSFP